MRAAYLLHGFERGHGPIVEMGLRILLARASCMEGLIELICHSLYSATLLNTFDHSLLE
jgi:hypothetical protein